MQMRPCFLESNSEEAFRICAAVMVLVHRRPVPQAVASPAASKCSTPAARSEPPGRPGGIAHSSPPK
eukprot:2524936-Lingulodinium_polyedra.AAC.1